MSKIELSRWQDVADGFPSDDYFDAVIVALEKAGVGVVESHRTEAWEFVAELDPASYADGDLSWAVEGLNLVWRVNEECDPLTEGFVGVTGSRPGWAWAAYRKPGLADVIRELGCPDNLDSPIDPLAEPSEVAAAVAALVRGSSDPEGK